MKLLIEAVLMTVGALAIIRYIERAFKVEGLCQCAVLVVGLGYAFLAPAWVVLAAIYQSAPQFVWGVVAIGILLFAIKGFGAYLKRSARILAFRGNSAHR